ncbi:MAG: transglycosylase family protein [Thermoleophilaceae bacterium]
MAALVAVPAALAATGPTTVAPQAALIDSPFEGKQLRREARRKLTEARRRAQRPAPRAAVPPQLQAIAQCESHGDPRAIGGGGQFRGKYQFTYGTWAGVGGHGDPAAAPEAEQDRRAAVLYARSGAGQWPVCGS